MKLKVCVTLLPFFLKEAFSNSHILSAIGLHFGGLKLKNGDVRYKQLKGKWSTASSGDCAYTKESWFQQSEWSGRGRWPNTISLPQGELRGGSCCAGETYNCVSPLARPCPVRLHAQLSNTPENSAQP